MKYKFYYNKIGIGHKIEVMNIIELIEADNDKEAVLKFFDKVGINKFGCIKETGECFDERKFIAEKEIIMKGC